MSRWRDPPDPQQIAMRPAKGAGNRGISAATSGADFIWNRIRWLALPANFRDASGVRCRRNQQRTRETRTLPSHADVMRLVRFVPQNMSCFCLT